MDINPAVFCLFNFFHLIDTPGGCIIFLSMKKVEELINNVIGQLNGINRMMARKQDCFKVLVQLKASRSALNSLTEKYMEKNFNSCLKTCKKNEQSRVCQRFFSELIKR